MLKVLAFGLLIGLCWAPGPAAAWWDFGHMQVAAAAYEKLTPVVRARADALIKLNPDCGKWIAGVAPERQALVAFARAATWADDIKKEGSGYRRESVTAMTAGDSLGYGDKVQHDYWHYLDIPFTIDGSRVEIPPSPNALTQIARLTRGLGSNEPDELKSFDLVWLLHLVGDVHQPLHATARFTRQLGGDNGGNDELVQVSGEAPVKLHMFWDRLLGECTPLEAIEAAKTLPMPDAGKAAIGEPAMWLIESFVHAQNVVYVPEIQDNSAVSPLPASYKQQALDLSKAQAALAAARLARLINGALGN